MRNLFIKSYDIIEKNMLEKEPKGIGYSLYKEYSKSLVKLCDMVDIFSTVNQ